MNLNFVNKGGTLISSIMAGIVIAIGGTVYLSLDNKIVGAVLFSVGLYLICLHKLSLFTGKVGYAIEHTRQYWIDLAIIWLGNLIGTGISALVLRQTRIAAIAQKAQALCAVKDADTLLSLFVLGIFCGILMYGAVEGFARTQNPYILFFCVSVFILCGFEHSIADMFYYTMAGAWSASALLRILVITAGNAIGAILLALISQNIKAQLAK